MDCSSAEESKETRDLEQALRTAAWDGRLQDVEAIVAKGVDINAGDEYGRTSLHLAAYQGQEAVVCALVNAGAQLDAKDKAHDTPLHYAAHEGRNAVARYLVAAGSPVGAKDKDGKTPVDWARGRKNPVLAQLLESAVNGLNTKPMDLMVVDSTAIRNLRQLCKDGDIEQVRVAVSDGVNVNATEGEQRWTALMDASWKGRLEVAKCLVDKGADANIPSKAGNTALHLAATHGHDEMVHLLLSAGARIEQRNEDRKTAIECARTAPKPSQAVIVILEEASKMNVSNKSHHPPLHLAVRDGDEESVKKLIDSGREDINSKDKISWTPLTHAVCKGNDSMLRIILDQKPDLDITDKWNTTALMWSVHTNKPNATQALVDAGADIAKVDDSQNTALHWCGIYGHEAIARILVIAGAKLDTKNKQRRTPLEEAQARGVSGSRRGLSTGGRRVGGADGKPSSTDYSKLTHGNHQLVTQLLEDAINNGPNSIAGSKTGEGNEEGLREAARNGRVIELERLIKEGVEVNSKGEHGKTALIFAADKGHEIIVQSLIRAGADLDLADDDGYTCLHWSVMFGHELAARSLLSAGCKVDTRDKHGKTPLDWAKSMRHTFLVRLLEGQQGPLSTSRPATSGGTPTRPATQGGSSSTPTSARTRGASASGSGAPSAASKAMQY